MSSARLSGVPGSFCYYLRSASLLSADAQTNDQAENRMRPRQASQRSWKPASRRRLSLIFILPLLACGGAPAATATEQALSTAELQLLVAAEAEAQARAAYPDADVTADSTPLDPRLRLTACADLETELRGPRRYGRISVAVSCQAPHSWRIFMNVDVSVEAPVLVTRRAMNRDEVLKPSDIDLERRNLADIRQAHYTGPEQALGKALKRPAKAGQVIYPGILKTPLAVRRGDRVTIVAEHGSVQITAPGLSLQNGEVGEQIRVRNTRSEKTVHGWIKAAGVVTTSPLAAAAGQVAKLD
jgi:flagella basal body P-ring formation protein FlgA